LQKRGAFIVIEGLDGSGKTTQARLLVQKLRSSHNAVYTTEPSRGKIGSFIRECCLFEEKRLDSATEALLFAADRIEHIQNEVVPALNKGLLVISDRYLYSSLAYQGSTGLSLEWIEAINKHALKPDLAVFIDVAPETVMQRLNRKKSVMETLETQRQVREVYLKFVANDDMVRIDGDKLVAELSEALYSRVLHFLKTFQASAFV
jgi:dTMP kinase